MKDGSLYAIGDTCYLKFYTIKDGNRVHKTIRLCEKSDLHTWWRKKGRWGFSSAVRDLQRETMDKIKADLAERDEDAQAKPASSGSRHLLGDAIPALH
jgi:hypothetical protein